MIWAQIVFTYVYVKLSVRTNTSNASSEPQESSMNQEERKEQGKMRSAFLFGKSCHS